EPEERVVLPEVLNWETTPRIEYPPPPVIPDVPPEVTVEWGTTAPSGSGWTDVSSYTIRVRDAGNGKRDIHFQSASAPSAPSPKPPPPEQPPAPPPPPPRSEEHTSELQSRENLVCRLLLEK